MRDERNAKIVKLWNDGLSASKIASLLNVSAPLVGSVIWQRRKLGDAVRSKRIRSNRDERNMSIVRLWNTGLSAKEVSDLVGCTKNVVLAVIVKHRELGDITRPAVYSRSERGKLAVIARRGLRRKKQTTTGVEK